MLRVLWGAACGFALFSLAGACSDAPSDGDSANGTGGESSDDAVGTAGASASGGAASSGGVSNGSGGQGWAGGGASNLGGEGNDTGGASSGGAASGGTGGTGGTSGTGGGNQSAPLAFTQTSVEIAAQSQAMVTLQLAAPAQLDVTIVLEASSGDITVPSSVVVPTGNQSVSFAVSLSNWATGTVTATLGVDVVSLYINPQ